MVVSFRHMLAVLAIALGFCWTSAVQAQTPSNRIALVIGNGAYKGAPNATAANDAGLVAQTLTAAGFDVSGARDLDGDATRRAFRDFLERASQLGPDGLAFVYLSGYAVQFEGDNYFVPVDATLARDTDVPIQAIRLSDLTRALAGVPLKGRIIVLDGAYRNPFPASANLAGGLALVDAEPGALLATNAAPGTLGPSTTESYGVYGQALAEMLRQGGIPVQEVFDRVRLRVNELTKGADVPWSVSKLAGSFVFLQSSPDAPQPAVPQVTYEQMQRRPLREFPVNEAYAAAIARDSFQGYQDFLAAYPDSPYGGRVRVILAARREALSWRKTVNVGTDRAYWTYLRRYPKGPHAIDARRRLQSMSVALLPPPDFDPIEYDVPPPPEQEYRYVDSPVVVFDEPDYGPPPPPPPDYFLPPPPEENVYRLPPPPSAGPGFLPIPIPIPIPYGRSPSGPGRLDPVEGVRGTYAQPRPFMQNPQGGLAPQLLPGQQDIRLRPPSPTLVPPPPVQANRPPLPQAVPGALPVPQRVLPPNLGPTSNPQVQQLQQRQQQIQQLQQQQLQQRQQVDQQRQQQLLQQKGQADQLRQQQQQTLQQLQEQLLQQKQQGDQQRQQLLQQRQQVDQQRQQQLLQQKGQADQARQQQQNLQQRQQQLLQQKQQGDQQRQQQILQQRQQVDQQRQQQQIQQQRQQVDQQRQQQLMQQRQQVDQQRQQQIQQQRQQVDQQRQQQQNQQQRQQVDQQRQQQQQILQQRQQQQQQNQQQQIQQQRQQQIQQLQQRAPQVQQHLPPGVRLDCGRPGQPPCH